MIIPVVVIGMIFGILIFTVEGESTPSVIFANTGESQNFKPMELEMMELTVSNT